VLEFLFSNLKMTLEEEEEKTLLLHGKAPVNTFVDLDPEWVTVHVPSIGQAQCYGIASSYSTEFPPRLKGVVEVEDFIDIMTRLNNTILNYWPCNLCYFCGYGCSLFTCGLSILLPHYCMSYSEEYAVEMLKHVSLKSKYYDRKIFFTIQKSYCQSFVEIRFPKSLLKVQQEPQAGGEETLLEEEEGSEESELLGKRDGAKWTVVLSQQPASRLKEL
jgi:hypothetical protein